jgi:alpha-glucoside transport system substrate-binding protein
MPRQSAKYWVGFLSIALCAFWGASVRAERIGTVRVMGVWGGEELKAFRSVIAPWENRTGGRVEFEGTRDLAAILRARVLGGNPPDLAILPNPAMMKEFAQGGTLQPIDKILDLSQVKKNYGNTWLDLGSVRGKLFGLFVKATVKSTVWYAPREFSTNGWKIPKTWEELIILSARIVREEKTPWAIALESGGASGWPASDWIQEIFLHESGGDLYDRWVDHQIPWTHEAVKSAFEKFGKIAVTQGYVKGGVQAILATNFMDASYLPFMKPPRAYMVFLGGFTQGFIAKQFPDLKAGEDYDFFPFPTIEPNFKGAATGAADVVALFRDSSASRSFLKYMAMEKSWEPWVRRGGYSSPNRSMNPKIYPDPVAAKLAQLLTSSPLFRFDADDLMPAEVQKIFWKGAMDYLRNPERLDAILQRIEEVAKEAYR